MEFLKRLWNDEEGQGMVEYGLIIALVAIAAILFFQPLRDGLEGVFQRIGDALGGAPVVPD